MMLLKSAIINDRYLSCLSDVPDGVGEKTNTTLGRPFVFARALFTLRAGGVNGCCLHFAKVRDKIRNGKSFVNKGLIKNVHA